MPPTRHVITDAIDAGGDEPPSAQQFAQLFARLSETDKARTICYMQMMAAPISA